MVARRDLRNGLTSLILTTGRFPMEEWNGMVWAPDIWMAICVKYIPFDPVSICHKCILWVCIVCHILPTKQKFVFSRFLIIALTKRFILVEA